MDQPNEDFAKPRGWSDPSRSPPERRRFLAACVPVQCLRSAAPTVIARQDQSAGEGWLASSAQIGAAAQQFGCYFFRKAHREHPGSASKLLLRRIAGCTGLGRSRLYPWLAGGLRTIPPGSF